MQKYRFDHCGEANPNGSVPVYTRWLFGPTLAGVRNCPVSHGILPNRTVYVTGEPDTWFSIPAACRFMGFRVTGYLSCEESGYVFNVSVLSSNKIRAAIDAVLSENNVPNLDGMDTDELHDFVQTYDQARNVRKLFPKSNGYFAKMYTQILADYAADTIAARRHRLLGNISAAMHIEDRNDSRYEQLPSVVLW